MSPRDGVRIGAILVVAFTACAAVAPARAQLYEDARRSLGLTPDPLARSPRLLGMGRLSFVLEDPRNRITLWDFARNPTGVLDDDSTSTLELIPSTHAASSLHDIPDSARTRERQDLAFREVRFGFETWHRTPGQSAYGLVGDMGLLRADRPISQDLERRSNISEPRVTGVVNGHLPVLLAKQMQYALRVVYGFQSSNDRFREIVRNAVGDYLDLDGNIVPPPDAFTPDEYSARTLGGGAALSYSVGEPLTIAAGFDQVGQLIKGQNQGGRYNSETRENRPFGSYQVTAVGRLAKQLEWGADAQKWRADSKASWLFSLSSGPASPPLAGRGSLYRRKEEGSTFRGRLRWMIGAFEVGGGFGAFRRETHLVAPAPNDTTSFNAFRNEVYLNANADTLFIPDSVVTDALEEKSWEGGGGIGWTRSDRRMSFGAEFHRRQAESSGSLAGLGPKRVGWDVRAGIEYAPGTAVRMRTGYIHRWEDRDDRTRNNEYLSNAATAGLGLSPFGATWTIESGFVYEWEQSDFGDPGRQRSSRQQLVVRIFWPI